MSWESLARVDAVECRTAGDVRALARRYSHLSTRTPVVQLVRESPVKRAEVRPSIIVRFPASEPFCHRAIAAMWADKNVTIITIQAINRAVCKHYNVTLADLHSHKRPQCLVRPRQVAMYLVRTLTRHSLPEIGRRMGGKDHTSVFYAVRNIAALMQTDPDLAIQVERFRQELTAIQPQGRAG